MKINPKATKAELLKIINDLRDEATGWHQAAKKAEDALGHADKWALRGLFLGFTLGSAAGFVVGVAL